MLDSLRDANATKLARHLAIDALKAALRDRSTADSDERNGAGT